MDLTILTLVVGFATLVMVFPVISHLANADKNFDQTDDKFFKKCVKGHGDNKKEDQSERQAEHHFPGGTFQCFP